MSTNFKVSSGPPAGKRMPMMKNLYRVLVLTQVAMLSGCGKPDIVQRFDSPVAGLFLTVETRYGHGAVSPDFTQIYAHIEANGKNDRELVMDGEYLEKVNVIWLSPTEVALCVEKGYREGFTDHFRNYATLRAGGVSKTIHSHFQEHCP
jgi:hypothetical protein